METVQGPLPVTVIAPGLQLLGPIPVLAAVTYPAFEEFVACGTVHPAGMVI
jgi:hypothetical protein